MSSSSPAAVLSTRREPAKTNGNGHARVERTPYTWDRLPAELLAQGKFTVYRTKPGKPGSKARKVPYQPKHTALRAKVNDPQTWANFELASAAYKTGLFDGVNVVTCQQFSCVDCDGCVENEVISEAAQQVMDSLPTTYWELSPSGTGLRGIFRSKDAIYIDKTNGVGLEAYSGRHFMSVTGWTVNDAPIAELTLAQLEPYRAKKTPTSRSLISADPITQGKRHAHLISLAGSMHRRGMSTNAMGDALTRENMERCVPPLEQADIVGILQSASKWPTVGDLVPGERKDVGNADRLLRYGGGSYRYVAAFKHWVVYDGTRWPVDDKEHDPIRSEAHAMVRAFVVQAVAAGGEELIKYAAGSLNSAFISNMIREAQSHATLTVEELDRDPLLINFLNGTLDAHTGMLREHRREDYITKLIPHNYNPEAQCPKWEKFILDAFEKSDDQLQEEYESLSEAQLPKLKEFLAMAPRRQLEMVKFLQRALGYTMTGLTSEKCLFLITGPTDTSKTTTMNVVGKLLGDYTQRIKVESLMQGRRNQGMDNNANQDLADLCGARFAPSSETGQGQRLREAGVKELTQGQGKYKAVRKYERHFTFSETWKIWLDCNHKPIIYDTDDAIWNRMVTIPFEHVVSKAEQNANLAEQLIAKEAEGILAWMVRGLAAWRTDGLELPEAMLQQREQWRKESDALGQWLETACVKDKGATAQGSELYGFYKQWRKENGLWEESIQIFARKMREHGFEKKEVGTAKRPTWFGVGVKALG